MKFFKPRSLRSGMKIALVVTLLAKAFGYTRQLVMAHSFGISRDLDIYLMASNLTMLLLLTYTTWFDQITVPQLVRIRETKGDEVFKTMCGSVFTFSIVMAVGLAVAFVIVLKPVSALVCHGFTPVERARVCYLALYFIPWLFAIVPYNAMSAIVKSLRFYDAVLLADLGVSVVSAVGFLFWHSHLVALPLFLSLGFGVSTLGLIVFTWRHIKIYGSLRTEPIRQMYRSFGQMFVVGQTYLVASAVERFYQSYLRPGSIAASGYAYQTLAPMFELLLFDELYIVSLSSAEQRMQRLERLLKGILLMTIPIACFLMWHSSDIVRLLYQRGHFDARAQELTSRIFQLLTLNLVTATFGMPLIRMLQITDKIYYSGYISLLSAGFLFLLNGLLVFYLKWDVMGTTAAAVIGSFFTIVLALGFLWRLRMTVDLVGIAKYGLWAAASTGLAIGLIRLLPPVGSFYLVTTAVHGVLFAALIAAFYWPVRANIKLITHGS